MTEQPVWPFRAQAFAVYRDGRADGPRSPLRAARWPLAVLAVLLSASIAFAAVVRVPQAVGGTVIGDDGQSLIAVFSGRLDPEPGVGASATLLQSGDEARLHVVSVEVVDDDASASRWGLPADVPRPVTVVLLSGGDRDAIGPVSVQVAAPTLLQMVPVLGRIL